MDTPAAFSRRLRPVAVPTVAALVAVVLFIYAGNWQRGKMEQKTALRAQFDAGAVTAAVPLPDTAAWESWRYRAVSATGRFDASRQILLDNKVHAGRVGFDVVTPLRLDDGRVVLVNRGWVRGGASRADLPAVPPPPEHVVVQGRINLPTTAYLELSRGAPTGMVWQNLDPSRFAQVTGLPVLPVVVEQTAPLHAADLLQRNRAVPDFGIGKHRVYMLQWYAFATLAAGLWLFFTWRRRR